MTPLSYNTSLPYDTDYTIFHISKTQFLIKIGLRVNMPVFPWKFHFKISVILNCLAFLRDVISMSMILADSKCNSSFVVWSIVQRLNMLWMTQPHLIFQAVLQLECTESMTPYVWSPHLYNPLLPQLCSHSDLKKIIKIIHSIRNRIMNWSF